MFKQAEYAKILADIGLTADQVDKLHFVLVELREIAERKMSHMPTASRDRSFAAGKVRGLDVADEFIRGVLRVDEFVD